MSAQRFSCIDDWDGLGKRLLGIAADTLRESVAKRSGASVTKFTVQSLDAGHVRIVTSDPALIAEEVGTPGRPPRPLMGPQREDLAQLRASLHGALRKVGL
jgi:hypothetical protein